MKRWSKEAATVLRDNGWAYGIIIRTDARIWEWWACHGWNSVQAVSGIAGSLRQAKTYIRQYRKKTALRRNEAA